MQEFYVILLKRAILVSNKLELKYLIGDDAVELRFVVCNQLKSRGSSASNNHQRISKFSGWRLFEITFVLQVIIRAKYKRVLWDIPDRYVRKQWVACGASVSIDCHLIIIAFVGHNESRVLGKSSVAFIILHINSKHHAGRCSQTVKIIVSEPKLAFQISKAFFVWFPVDIKVHRAIHAPLKDGPSSAISCHVTQHLKGFFFIRVNPVHTVSFGTILIIVKTVLRAI